MMRRYAFAFLLAFFAASPALADAPSPASDCESHDAARQVTGCNAILAAGPDMEALDFEAYNNRALAELQLNQPKPALADAQAGIALNPGNGRIYLTLARAYLALRQPQQALGAVNQAIALIPDDPAPLILRGEIELLGGDWQGDVADQDAALGHDP
ncbi:MAG: tetratricopeptide repeat protein, partial [Rhodospirillales bacterium]|nr:tetratricopeptide repeat protein [Rhodospirillales bacterium]